MRLVNTKHNYQPQIRPSSSARARLSFTITQLIPGTTTIPLRRTSRSILNDYVNDKSNY
jgi:hypothetical protein